MHPLIEKPYGESFSYASTCHTKFGPCNQGRERDDGEGGMTGREGDDGEGGVRRGIMGSMGR